VFGMFKTEYMNLQPTEIGILTSASTIFAAKVSSGRVDADNEDQAVEECVDQAIKLAKRVESLVKTQGEMG
jgi:hypothetical protein